MRRPLLLVDITAKLLMLALLAHAVLFPDLPQYVGKGMGYRLGLYPLSVVLLVACPCGTSSTEASAQRHGETSSACPLPVPRKGRSGQTRELRGLPR